jgi:hypothetical protein
VIDGGALTVRLNCIELLPNALVALTVNLATANTAGVPLMMPVELSSVSPVGSVPLVSAHEIGLVPEAVRVCE